MFSQVSRTISDAMYRHEKINGGWYHAVKYLNVSFNFGGQNYPIYLLDLIENLFRRRCMFHKFSISVILAYFPLSQYQPMTSAFGTKSIYSSGSPQSNTLSTKFQVDSYVQLASIIGPTAAWQNLIRLGRDAYPFATVDKPSNTISVGWNVSSLREITQNRATVIDII